MNTENIDPMDMDVSGIDTNFPRLAVGVYELIVNSCEVVPNKAETGNNMKIGFETRSDAKSTTGEPIAAGAKLSMYIGMVPSERYSQMDIAKKIAKFMKAADIEGKPSLIVNDPSIMVGKVVSAKIGLNKATDEYDESNSVKDFVIKK